MIIFEPAKESGIRQPQQVRLGRCCCSCCFKASTCNREAARFRRLVAPMQSHLSP